MKFFLAALIGLALLGGIISTPLLAQEEENKEAPEILTTDLTRRQKVDASQLNVSFVIFDDDVIAEVIIDGEKQKFIKANTLTINKRFIFRRGINEILVTAIDEKGNQRTNKYQVAFGVDLEELEEPSDSTGFAWKILGNVRYNHDTNPNNDLGLPVDIEDVSVEGQIADDEQADTQTAASLMAVVTWGRLAGFAGYLQSNYTKEIYEPLNSQIILAGLSYAPKASEKGLTGRYMFLDINRDDENYAQFHILTAGLQIGRFDNEDGTTKHWLGVLYNHKEFADSNLDAGNTSLFKWEYSNLDAEKLDFFKSVIAYGTGNDGSERTEYTTATMDFDWSNKWESGFLQGTGFGIHAKEYPNQQPLSSDLGDSRIDIPIRFSFHLGWAFTPIWSLKLNYEYKVNVSTKNPSYRTVTGVQLAGGF